MNYKKILFATDFSPASDAALHYATALARDSGAVLLLLHVEESPAPITAGEMMLPQPTYPNPELRRMLDAVEPDDPSVRYEHVLVQGSAAEEIVSVANDRGVDLIVMGTHGRTGLRRVLMGSVAEAVMRHADCPVLTLREGSKVASGTV
jgi:universal stress protein A